MVDQAHHTSKQYDAELEHIRSQVLTMGGLVQRQLLMAMEGMNRGDTRLADRVISMEHEVNAMEVSIDELCTTVIAKRQPASNDLRLLMMVFKTLTDLERIGDEAKKIAFTVRRWSESAQHQPPRIPEISVIAELAAGMLESALAMFRDLDVEPAGRIEHQDLELDAHFRGILRQLLTYMIEDPRTISTSLNVIFVAKSIERIGDHSKNISEYVVYMIKGKDVRHVSVEEIEKTVKP